ncbi:hypothetical protein V1522DRAFT_389191 [Lipomyces starkeyi]
MALPNPRRIFASFRTDEEERQYSRRATWILMRLAQEVIYRYWATRTIMHHATRYRVGELSITLALGEKYDVPFEASKPEMRPFRLRSIAPVYKASAKYGRREDV